MSSEPERDSPAPVSSNKGGNDSAASRLPFEPVKRKKAAKNRPASKEPANKASASKATATNATATKQTQARPISREEMGVPEVVSRRMIRRMALFCGIPTALGISTFIASYIIVSNDWFRLPNSAVVLVSMGCFGLGVLGLSYGVFSASWDENIPGTKLGWTEFTTNLGRMTDAWRSARQKK